MNLGRTVFSQLLDFLPTYEFQICVDRYQGNRYVKDFSCWDQFLCLAVRSTHLSPQPAGYRSLSPLPALQTLSHGFAGKSFAQHAGARQRGSRLADLPRLRASVDSPRARSLPRRIFRRGLLRDRVRLRLDHHRFVPLALPLGKVPPPQKCGQTAHAVGRAGQHSHQCLCDRRAGPRCEPSRRTAAGTGSVLLARSRLCGLRASPSVHASLRQSPTFSLPITNHKSPMFRRTSRSVCRSGSRRWPRIFRAVERADW